jgi:TPR repeat protein
MTGSRIAGFSTFITLLIGLFLTAPSAQPADDTPRFYGRWITTFQWNGQTVTMLALHDSAGYRNFIVQPNGNTPAGSGTFTGANGKYKTNADPPNDSGTYRFLDADTVVCTNAAGQTITWRRDKPVTPAAPRSPSVPQPAAPPAYTPDPSLPPETNAAIAAFNQKDYSGAWRNFMAAAQKGDAEAEAGVGAMIFKHLNPPGTGFYPQCEKWLLASANQGNPKGMDFLGQFYYASGVSIQGGINPGVNNAPIPPALQRQAESRFALARQWFERAAAKNDGYAMGNLAIMLDAGVGGPADPAAAARLRERLKHPNDPGYTDPDFVKRATADPGNLALSAAWQAGHYAEALEKARAAAEKGDANAQALLGRAYYEGVGVTRSYPTALIWLNKAVAKNNPDAMFFLGLMYEHSRGVGEDLPKALALFDRAAALGQRYAQMEARGMRMAGEEADQAARYAAVCHARGGIVDGPTCFRGGLAIDPY